MFKVFRGIGVLGSRVLEIYVFRGLGLRGLGFRFRVQSFLGLGLRV